MKNKEKDKSLFISFQEETVLRFIKKNFHFISGINCLISFKKKEKLLLSFIQKLPCKKRKKEKVFHLISGRLVERKKEKPFHFILGRNFLANRKKEEPLHFN